MYTIVDFSHQDLVRLSAVCLSVCLSVCLFACLFVCADFAWACYYAVILIGRIMNLLSVRPSVRLFRAGSQLENRKA